MWSDIEVLLSELLVVEVEMWYLCTSPRELGPLLAVVNVKLNPYEGLPSLCTSGITTGNTITTCVGSKLLEKQVIKKGLIQVCIEPTGQATVSSLDNRQSDVCWLW